MIFFWVVIWPSLCVAVALAARNRANRNPWGWFALAFLLSPLVGLLLLLAVGRKPPQVQIYPPGSSTPLPTSSGVVLMAVVFALVAGVLVITGYSIAPQTTQWRASDGAPYNTGPGWADYQRRQR